MDISDVFLAARARADRLASKDGRGRATMRELSEYGHMLPFMVMSSDWSPDQIQQLLIEAVAVAAVVAAKGDPSVNFQAPHFLLEPSSHEGALRAYAAGESVGATHWRPEFLLNKHGQGWRVAPGFEGPTEEQLETMRGELLSGVRADGRGLVIWRVAVESEPVPF